MVLDYLGMEDAAVRGEELVQVVGACFPGEVADMKRVGHELRAWGIANSAKLSRKRPGTFGASLAPSTILSRPANGSGRRQGPGRGNDDGSAAQGTSGPA